MFPGIIWSFLFGLSSDDFGWHNAVLPGWFVPRQGLSLTFVFVIISCSISCHGFYKWCRFSWLKLEAMLTLKCVIVQYPSTIPTRSMLLWQNIHFEPFNLFLSTEFPTLIKYALMTLLNDVPFMWQVLPKENGVRYPWSFMFQACFWRKKRTEHGSCKFSNIDYIYEKTNLDGKDVHKLAMEAISLEMKQQELDGR